MKDIIFREYDIRGIVGAELMLDQIYSLVCAIIYYLKEQNPSLQTVAVGMDGRTHSPLIKEEMVRALIDNGLAVIDIGLCPSPVLYFTLYDQQWDAGLMITASHNPAEYNGIKICLGTESLWGAHIQAIKERYRAGRLAQSEKKGLFSTYDAIAPYISWLENHFVDLKGLTLPMVFDCGNGATAAVVPHLITVMKWQHVRELCCSIDGSYPNHEADPTVEKNMRDVQKMLSTTDAQLGIGFDGDGDRMGAMTKSGILVPGDQLLALFALDILAHHPGAGVVFDVKASRGLIELLERYGAKPYMSACGHAIVKNELKKRGALLGGELSCHFFFKDRHFGFDDGIYAALRLIQIMHRSRKSLEELLTVFPHKLSSPELRIPCKEECKSTIVEIVKKQLALLPDVTIVLVDGVRAEFPYGWALIRASNTQPVLSLRFEADTPEQLQQLTNTVMDLIKAGMATQGE